MSSTEPPRCEQCNEAIRPACRCFANDRIDRMQGRIATLEADNETLMKLGNSMAVHACASRAYERSDRLADAIDKWEATRDVATGEGEGG